MPQAKKTARKISPVPAYDHRPKGRVTSRTHPDSFAGPKKQISYRADYLEDQKREIEIEKAQFLLALENSLGIVKAACQATSVHRDKYYTWMKEDHEFAAKVCGIDEVVLDFAESKLFKSISEGNLNAVTYFLSRKGRRRGYTDRTEVTGADGKALSVEGAITHTMLKEEVPLLSAQKILERLARSDRERKQPRN